MLVLFTKSHVLMLINRTVQLSKSIVEVGLSLLAHTHMPHKYWDEAFLAVTYLINHLPTKVLQFSTPLELLFKEKTSIMGSVCLDVRVNLIYDPSTPINFNFGLSNLCSLDIEICIKDLNALILLVVGCIFLEMLSLTKACTPLGS
jgi:hypothetical protein